MPYHAAWRIGWSFFWRRALWLAALGVCLSPVIVFTRHLASPLYVQALIAAIILIEALFIHPLVVKALPGIQYRDFRLVVAGRRGPRDELRYGEALLISAGPSAVLIFCESIAVLKGMFVLFLVYPAAAWMLTYPWGRCRLEVAETLSPYGPVLAGGEADDGQ